MELGTLLIRWLNDARLAHILWHS